MLDYLEFAFQGFLQLNNSRGSNGYGPSALTLTDISSWLSIAGIDDPDEKIDYVDYIQALDEVWMQHQYNERKSKKDAEEKKKKERQKEKEQRRNKNNEE